MQVFSAGARVGGRDRKSQSRESKARLFCGHLAGGVPGLCRIRCALVCVHAYCGHVPSSLAMCLASSRES